MTPQLGRPPTRNKTNTTHQ